MAADEERTLRDRRAEIQAASGARRLQRQEDARKLIEEANAITRREEDEDDGVDEA